MDDNKTVTGSNSMPEFSTTDIVHNRNQQQAIRVFISSKCDNNGPFTLVRESLADKLNQTGIFSAYIWERGGAATTSAEQTYRMELRDSNICVFIIDNSADVPEGVLNEIDEARRCGKKSLYYFCVEHGEKHLPLRDRLNGPKGPTYTIVKRLCDVSDKVVSDLQEDVLRLYRGWCNNFFIDRESLETISVRPSFGNVSVSLKKDDLRNLNGTSAFFANFLLSMGNEEIATGALDSALLSLAKSLYTDFDIAQFDPSKLLGAIEVIFPEEYVGIIKIRWEAIHLYFTDNSSSAIKLLDELLESSRTIHIDKWLVDDILIDLINITQEVDPSIFNNRYQQQLSKEESGVFYPQIDRSETCLYERMDDDRYKELTKSINTVTFGDNITRFIEELVQLFAISACFGSLTHLSRVLKHMKNVLHYLSTKYGNSNLRTTFLKLSIADGKRGDGELILQSFSTTQFDTEEDLAIDLFTFCSEYKCLNNRNLATFEAFGMIGCYLDESDFYRAQAIFIEKAEKALADEDPWEPRPKSVFNAIRSNLNRLPVDWIVSFCSAAINSMKLFWIGQSLDLVAAESKRISMASRRKQDELLGAIQELIENTTDSLCLDSACNALIGLSNYTSLSQGGSVDQIANLLPGERRAKYLRFSKDVTDETLSVLASERLCSLEAANKTQGVGGAYAFGTNHAELFSYYLLRMHQPDLGLAQRGLIALTECLLSKQQDCTSKLNAVKALESLLMNFNIAEIDPNTSLIELLDNPDSYLSAANLGRKESVFLLDIHMSAISIAIGRNTGEKLILSLARCYGEDLFTQANVDGALHLLLSPSYIHTLPSWILSGVFSYASYMATSAHFQLNFRGLELLSDCLLSKELRNMASEILMSSYTGQVPRCKYIIIDAIPTIFNFNPDIASQIESLVKRDNASIFADYLTDVKNVSDG